MTLTLITFFIIGFVNGFTAYRAYNAIRTADFIRRAIGN